MKPFLIATACVAGIWSGLAGQVASAAAATITATIEGLASDGSQIYGYASGDLTPVQQGGLRYVENGTLQIRALDPSGTAIFETGLIDTTSTQNFPSDVRIAFFGPNFGIFDLSVITNGVGGFIQSNANAGLAQFVSYPYTAASFIDFAATVTIDGVVRATIPLPSQQPPVGAVPLPSSAVLLAIAVLGLGLGRLGSKARESRRAAATSPDPSQRRPVLLKRRGPSHKIASHLIAERNAMPGSTQRLPGPDHPITTARCPDRVTVTAGGHAIADTTRAVTLKEASYPAVLYVPREDVDMTALTRTDHGSHCPYKGDASYFSIPAAGERGVNAVWSYEQPYPAVADIRGHLAFYPDRVKITVQPTD